MAAPRLVAQNATEEVYELTIPTNQGMAGHVLEYSFEWKLDGIANPRVPGYTRISIDK